MAVLGYGCLDLCHDPFITILAQVRNRDYRISEWVPWSLLVELRRHMENPDKFQYLPYDKTEELEMILYRWGHDTKSSWEQMDQLRRTVFKTYTKAVDLALWPFSTTKHCQPIIPG